MNFVVAVLIGAVIGLAAWFLVPAKRPSAIWIGPVAGAVGAVIASAIATVVSAPGYGIKEIALQVALAAAAVVGTMFLPSGQSGQPAKSE
ncbi:GlsB/YeaQ/YmgE family stress response membrane protein [Allorhizocola rhizosphaerae]|uniref:GlsB/YeaQ/YmgE family stress response membrane protein n=1 Tax=Allorhizocola rhizosphaerae TaxID=1872709 RepID=UPI000E3CB711|nr:hypothetical protein [Allorhizocola rhizosphaerae]